MFTKLFDEKDIFILWLILLQLRDGDSPEVKHYSKSLTSEHSAFSRWGQFYNMSLFYQYLHKWIFSILGQTHNKAHHTQDIFVFIKLVFVALCEYPDRNDGGGGVVMMMMMVKMIKMMILVKMWVIMMLVMMKMLTFVFLCASVLFRLMMVVLK